MTSRTKLPEAENVILLTVDALRADHLSCFGYPRPTTPNFDQLTAKNVAFTNAISTSSHTREAIPSLLTGRYPDEAIDDRYHLDAPTIAGILLKRDFRTGAFHSNPFLSRGYGYADDFDTFYDDLYIGRHKLVALLERAIDKVFDRHYARAPKINRRSSDWLTSLDDDRPFFLWNHYMDVHGPYEPPTDFQRHFRDEPVNPGAARRLYKRALDDPASISEEQRRTLVDLYDAEIRYLDDQLGTFVQSIQRSSKWEDTLLVITADHGDAFGERGYYEHPRQLDLELLRVPLLVAHHEFEQTTIDVPTSTLDLVPTIYDAVGAEREGLEGRSLFDIAEDPESYRSRVVYASATGIERERHLRRYGAWNGDELATIVRGPDGKILERSGDRALVRELKSFSSDRKSTTGRAPAGEHIEEAQVAERLRALGYRE